MYMCVLVHVHVTTGTVPVCDNVFIKIHVCTMYNQCMYMYTQMLVQLKDGWLFHIITFAFSLTNKDQ